MQMFSLIPILNLDRFALSIRALAAIVFVFVFSCFGKAHEEAKENPPIDFESDIKPILTTYCGGCHTEDDAANGFSVDTYKSLMSGYESGPVLTSGDSQASYLIDLMVGKDGYQMPPEGEPQPTDEEIAAICMWIDAGAENSEKRLSLAGQIDQMRSPTDGSRRIAQPPLLPVLAIIELNSDELLFGRYGELIKVPVDHVDHVHSQQNTASEVWATVTGKITDIRISKDGQSVLVASGVPGVGGQLSVFSAADASRQEVYEVADETLYAVAESPDGEYLAGAGYDRKIYLWERGRAVSQPTQILEGHNGAIFDLDFHPTAPLLASASADETIKLWSVETFERLDTLGQGEAEQYSCRFSPDGNTIAGAGADQRIRIWRVVSLDRPAINPMESYCYAHQSGVSKLSFTPSGKHLVSVGQDQQIKLWQLPKLQLVRVLGEITASPTDMVLRAANQTNVGSLDLDTLVSQMNGRVERIRGNVAISKPTGTEEFVAAAAKEREIPTPAPMNTPAELNTQAKLNAMQEAEPNSTFAERQQIDVPLAVTGVIATHSLGADGAAPSDLGDEDWYEFDAKRGEIWMITAQAEKDSPVDCKIEIRNHSNELVERTRLQALQESYLTFRGKDSDTIDDFRVHNWEDMELNQYLYVGGEVVRLWLYPRGPDSGFKVYPGVGGKRFPQFDTTATSHALGEPAWIVRPLAPSEERIENGLPVFPIYFENDDDAERRSSKDARLTFTAPADGKYSIRVRDARGQYGEAYRYQLTIQQPQPSFTLKVTNKVEIPSPSISIAAPSNAGAGVEFVVTATRTNGFDGPISIEVPDLPDGLRATSPLTIEAGQIQAIGTLYRVGNQNPFAPEMELPNENPDTNNSTPESTPTVEINDSESTISDPGTIEKAPQNSDQTSQTDNPDAALSNETKPREFVCRVVGKASISGESIEVSAGTIQLIEGDAPKVHIEFFANDQGKPGAPNDELRIRPGQTISAWM